MGWMTPGVPIADDPAADHIQGVNKMKRRLRPACFLVLALMLLVMGNAMCARTVVIQVSDEVDLKDVKATTVSGQTFLPVRQVAEAMGAKVTWDEKAGLLTISGESGTAVLKLGDTAATINGTKVSFPVSPFLFRDRFFAPLDFYQRFFNMGLIWDPLRQAYRWVWILPPAPYPTPPVIFGPGSDTGRTETYPAPEQAEARRVVAELVRVRPSRTNPTIVVSIGNRTATYAVARDATILRGRVGGRSIEVPLAELRPGDRVTLQLNDAGVVTSLRAQYQEVRGAVQSISDGRIALDTGRTLKTTERTRVVLPGNTRGRIEDLMAGDTVIAGVSPISGDTFLIAVQRPTRPGQDRQQTNVILNTYGPMAVGDILRVTFLASAGGQASLTIPGLLDSAPMAETSPGTYQADYTVKPGDILAQPVRITFVRPDGARFETVSSRPVVIATDSAYLPRITSPTTGQIISSPIVVTGLARPGSRVQVSVEFRRDIAGVMPIEGLSDIQVVRADDDGVWKTDPLAATAPFHDLITDIPIDFGVLNDLYEFEEYPTVYVITATEIGPDETPVSSYTVETLKGRGTEVGL